MRGLKEVELERNRGRGSGRRGSENSRWGVGVDLRV